MTKYQRAYLPIKKINVTQGYGLLSSTHKYSYALDIGGDYELIAPFDCKVTKVYKPTDTKKSREVWLTSTKKVLCANGVYDFLTLSITHPANISKMVVGTIYKQFESLGISTSVMTGTSTGKHSHLELTLGKAVGWDENVIAKHKAYVNKNRIKLEDHLFALSDSTIKKETYKLKKYHFKKESEITFKVKGVPSEPLMIRDGSKAIGKLYNGDEVLKFNDKTNCLVYHYGKMGTTLKKYLKK